MRNLDIIKQRAEEVKKAAVASLRDVFPVKGRTRTLALNDITVDDKAPANDFSGQAKVKAKEGTWGASVYANLSLIDNATGKVIDKAPRVRLFTLPQITERFSYIVKGNEYQVATQMRLKSGVYTLQKQNGELKTQINLSRGKNFDLLFKEDTGLFTIAKVGGGQSNIPVYSILTHLGISPQAMSKAWGEKIMAANRAAADPNAVSRLKDALNIKTDIKEYFQTTQIRPDTTKIQLGQSFDKVSGQLILAATRDLLQTHLGKKKPADRDSLEFKEAWSVEDFIGERLEGNKRTLARKIMRTIDNPKRTKISQIVNPGAFNSTIESFFTQDDKSSTPEQTNPLDMLSGFYRTTIMGSGGVKSEHAITDEMREIHPTHYGFLDPIQTPESKKIGANLNIPLGAVKVGKEIMMRVVDKNGKQHTLTPHEARQKKIAFPGQKGQRVKAQHLGKVIEINRNEVDYFTPSPQSIFSWSSNLIPYLPSNQGNRAMMASKQMEQAIALKNREAPLVQVGVGKKSLESHIGESLAVRAPDDGVITSVSKDAIRVKTKSGVHELPLYNNFTLNRKSFMHHETKVKKGDRVKKGQLLADSNYTKDGTLALGTNLRVAYLPYKGLNFEDGIAITESAAEKLTSEHIHKKHIDVDERTRLNLNRFRSYYPNALTPDNVKKLDADGVIRKGEKVKMGDALIAAVRDRDTSKSIAMVHKVLSNRPKDVSVTWPYEDEGIVMDVQRSRGKVTVFVKTEEKAKIGDKLAGRMGNKGIITKIIPDEQAPKDKDGNAVQVLLNPHGVISRINIGQIYESAAGKAALKEGKVHTVNNFSGENYLKETKSKLRQAGVEDKEELFDPESGKSLGKVHVGNPYILKLFKQSTSNFSVRQGGPGTPYDVNQQPLKAGGDEGAKAVDVLTVNSLLAHGARANLREMSTIKANQNDEFWKALKSGQMLPPPRSTFAYEKFNNYLKASGIDPKKDGSKVTLAPLTDKQVDQMSVMEVSKPLAYRGKDMTPIRGGLFDQAKMGGFKGTKWGHIELKETVVNPVFEAPIKKLTGLGGKFEKVMSGELFLGQDGKLNDKGQGVTGGAAVEKLLKNINVKEEINVLLGKAKTAKRDKLDDINKRLRYLQALDNLKMRPEEAYLRKKVPVIPPVFRPIYPQPDGNVTSSDVNFLYQNTGVLNKMMDLPVMKMLPEKEKADLRKDIYQHVKGISGLTDLNIKGRYRDGFIREISGGTAGGPGAKRRKQAKEGFFISKMLSKKQDFVGRGTIIPEPTLGVDEVALPEQMAWKLFEPFVVRELKSHGKTPLQAQEEIKKKSLLAKKALEMVMKDRKVMLNRAPSLHKFSIMAFKPQMTTGKAIKIPPLVVNGFNADFDGDTMTVHVPVTDEANKEAEKMMPSRNLFKPGTGKLMIAPSQEAQVGIFYLSKSPAGRAKLNKILGQRHAVKTVLDKKQTGALLKRMAQELKPDDFADKVARLKEAGESEAFGRGFSLGLDDLADFSKERDKIVGAVAKANPQSKDQTSLYKINNQATKMIDGAITKKLKGKDNSLYDMVDSGARGGFGQLRQILATPLFVTDAKQRIVPVPIKKSYSEGLDISDYWTSMYGARRGMMDRALQTSLPGAFSKEIMATTINNVISSTDCGTKDGTFLDVTDPDIIGRYLAGNQGGVAHNTLIDSQIANRLKKSGLKKIKVRGPLTCLQAKGTCSKCYGKDELGNDPEVGDNIGAKAGQTISEPLIQMVMNSFHAGGTAGSGSDATGYARINQLLQLPKAVPGAAPLATEDGKVTKIEPGLAGGYTVYVNNKKHHVPKGRQLKVKQGSKVKAGDPLSDGAVKPQDLVKYKGMREAQEYIVDELKNSYHNQGVPVERKVFETVVRSLGNNTQVLNNPGDSSYLPGDIIPYTVANHHNRNRELRKPVDEAATYKLAENTGSLRKGHVLTPNDIRALKASGVKEVAVLRDEIKHAPVLKGINTLPLFRRDWMGAMGFRNLAKALTEGAGQGWSTDLEGYHPVPALAHGATFGKGKDGKY